ncbi:ketoacyl-synt-domain-containing protein, partial [Lindgomyces ingoldianus]
QPIAIIGSACRLPGSASSPSKLWVLLQNPVELLKEAPRDRFNWEGVYRPDGLHSSSKTKDGYWLEENIRQFDPQFFNIPPAEAETLDPQHRILLENVYEAMESAGLTLEDLQGSDTGVFVGLMGCEYFDNATFDLEASSGQMLTTGTGRNMAANRISYTFDFRGPSMTIDTACSSSMMAVHLAVSSLRRGECKVAFACGASLNLVFRSFVSLTKMKMISPDGRSKMFDETANGYGKGEGVAVVCLKRLDMAIEDGDYIECIIRETGTNQDGRTRGIAMPSAEAQADLIRQTYRRAGLDPTQIGSRPSFFEAHGTGTPAGDPVEAQAVEAAFFPPDQEYADDEILYIGSIKTVVGHTEGTAGIAGMLKAVLAVQNGVIPPNLLFSRMNPSVEPYSKHLRLVTAANPWPLLPAACPRRASINSFGFGGSNVHVILESYADATRRRIASMTSVGSAALPIFTPFTFSGISERTLVSTLETLLQYLKDHSGSVSLRDLAWTLQYKRSQFPFRCAIAARTSEELQQKLESTIQIATSKGAAAISTRASSIASPRIMGIFTGQGAQWATMGKDLIGRSAYAREIIEKLDSSLSSLPVSDRPKWKLKEELMIDGTQSRMHDATLSQPSTTAVQILLVDLLRAAGVKLHVVVGHSSGEIGAAYAAGLISAEHAIKIAYYRGHHSGLAAGKNNQAGAMLATFMTAEHATELCNDPDLLGRISIAAFNSPSIVTLSGDAEAIDEAATVLERRKIFARRLKVDKAYHSYHMSACAVPYLQSLEQCGMSPLAPPEDAPMWFSSVHCGKRMAAGKKLRGSYWIENLTSPVRFSEAITTAISEMGLPDLFLEVGPHPALKVPVQQIVGETAKSDNAYIGLINRGQNSKISFSNALGNIWSRFSRSAVDFRNYDAMLSNGPKPTLIKDLPTYPWQHDKEYWWENRYLRRRFQETLPPSELLGHSLSIGAQHEAKWRHFLKPKEIPWLLDHKLNGLAVLPGAAYVVMATTAAERLFQKHPIEVIEIEEIHFLLPISFADEDSAIETVLTVTTIDFTQTRAKADFFVDFCSHQRRDEMMTAARGKLVVRFGIDLDRAHPEGVTQHSILVTVGVDLFYQSLRDEGFTFTGPFRSITSLRRRMDFAAGEIRSLPSEMTFHPAMLDGLLQGAFAAHGFPGDSAMPNFRVPSYIKSIKIFPTRCGEIAGMYKSLRFEVMKTGSQEYGGLLYSPGGEGATIYVEGLSLAPFHFSTSKDDLKMFSEVVWRPCIPNAQLITSSFVVASEQMRLAKLIERVALFYLRTLNRIISYEEEQRADQPLRHLLEYARLVSAEALLGLNPHLEQEWLQDTEDDISEIVKANPGSINLELLDLVGKAYPFIICRQENALSTLMENDMLSRLYRYGLGFPETNACLARVVQTISNRSSNIRILEIGAGTGSVTGSILESAAYSSYTFTDISPAFLGSAKQLFRRFADKMLFKTFDMDKDIVQQGYDVGSFEVIVASNVLHASADVPKALRNIRALLRPGGYMVCLELAKNRQAFHTTIMGGLPGWWLGHGTDRSWSPALKVEQWDKYLRKSGFGGIDAITPVLDELLCPYHVFTAQAVDDRVMAIRKPLSFSLPMSSDSLMIIGEDPIEHKGLITGIENLLSASFKELTQIPGLEDLNRCGTIPSVVLCLVELDKPLFLDITPAKLATLQKLFTEATDIVWITKGCRVPTSIEAAYGNMMVGLGRSVRHELPHLRLAFSDFDTVDSVNARNLSQEVLRWYMLGQWAAEGWRDDVLFGHHNETAVEDGVKLYPSIVHSKARNFRYNAQHRRITHDVRPHTTPVELHFKDSNGLYNLREAPHTPSQSVGNSTLFVKMLYSTLYATKISSMGYLFVGLGINLRGDFTIVFSDTISSWVEVPRYAVHACSPSKGFEKQYLHAFACNLVAERVIKAARTSGHLMVLSADPLCMSFIEERASKLGKKVVFITSIPLFERDRAIFVHPHSLDVKIRQSIPEGVSVLINISNRPQDEVLFKRVSSMFESRCSKLKDSGAIFKPLSSGYDSVSDSSASSRIVGKNVEDLEALPPTMYEAVDVYSVSPKDLAQRPLQNFSSILDWTATDRIPVSIQPASVVVKFCPDKTYLIIGTSDIARSICEWMIVNGARYVLMASRNPDSLSGWAKDMESKGAFVDLHVADVTCESSIREMIVSAKKGLNARKIVMPPFGGMIHLALVLKDAVFTRMTFEELQAVTDVKARGSRILHEQLLDEMLDFFIMASSVSYVLGNPGQANYICGNAFMVGLSKYRRSIGLAASVVDLGRVTGIGYISRSERAKVNEFNSEDIRKRALYPISERDLHQIFAEAVLASPHDSRSSPEIITGLRNVEPDMLPHSPWANEPMFAHLLTPESTDTTMKSKPQLSVREKLSEELSSVSTTLVEDNVYDIVRSAFMDRLSVLLQIDVEDIDESVSLLDLGIDSLVATDIGSWARKELRVQVPHSMVFGGASALDLVKFAVEHLDR